MEKYDIVKLLGSGSYGECYLVREKTSREQFVMKQMSLSSEKMQASAFTEAKLLRTLKHPNIVEYHDHFEIVSGKPPKRFLCAVMTFCEQGDLLQRMIAQKGVPFPEKQILEYFVQLLLALEYIHSKRVLHRDIKAQNIFLSHNVVKLGDFGISKILEGSIDLASTVIGTPYYMSPELLRNKPYGYKSDVWAAGCVLYEMLCLKHAFDGKDYLGLVNNIIKGQVPPVPQHYSQHIRDILRAMLQKEPEKRPTVKQVLSHPMIRSYMAEVAQQQQARAAVVKQQQQQQQQQQPQAAPLPPVAVSRLKLSRERQTPFAAAQPQQQAAQQQQQAAQQQPPSQHVAISPARLKLLRQLEVKRRAKDDLAAQLDEVRNKRPVLVTPPSEPEGVGSSNRRPGSRMGMLGLEVPVLVEEKKRAKSPSGTAERRNSLGVGKEMMFPLAAVAVAAGGGQQQQHEAKTPRPASVSEERKPPQVVEKREKHILQQQQPSESRQIKKTESSHENLHTSLSGEHRRTASADIGGSSSGGGSDEIKLKEELDKMLKDQEELELSLETLIMEEKEEEGEQERSMVMASYAEHARAPSPSPPVSSEGEEEADAEDHHTSPGEVRRGGSQGGVVFPDEEDLPNTLVERVKFLKQFCVERMGEGSFQRSYVYTRNNEVIDEDDPGLLSVLGPNLAPYSKALLSLVMTEKDLPPQASTPSSSSPHLRNHVSPKRF